MDDTNASELWSLMGSSSPQSGTQSLKRVNFLARYQRAYEFLRVFVSGTPPAHAR